MRLTGYPIASRIQSPNRYGMQRMLSLTFAETITTIFKAEEAASLLIERQPLPLCSANVGFSFFSFNLEEKLHGELNLPR